MSEDIVYRLRKRAEIRRQIKTRKSVQEGKEDRLSDLLDEAALEIDRLRKQTIRDLLSALLREHSSATIIPTVEGEEIK